MGPKDTVYNELGEFPFNLKIPIFLLLSLRVPENLSFRDQCAMCFSLLRKDLVIDFVSEENSSMNHKKVNMSVFSVLGWFENECESVTGNFTLESWSFACEGALLFGSRVHLQILACWVVFADHNSLPAET